jgi:prepilin peptidase CpaA
LVFHAVVGDGLLFALGGFGVGFGLLLILWIIGGGGGGDVKFMGALGCWLGAWLTVQVLVLSAILAGALTLTMTARNVFQLKRTSPNRHENGSRRKGRETTAWAWRVPFGVPAALAAWCVLGLQLAGFSLRWPPIH